MGTQRVVLRSRGDISSDEFAADAAAVFSDVEGAADGCGSGAAAGGLAGDIFPLPLYLCQQSPP